MDDRGHIERLWGDGWAPSGNRTFLRQSRATSGAAIATPICANLLSPVVKPQQPRDRAQLELPQAHRLDV
jgi:hypothetical protein